jgi:hypothetical protein
LCFSAVCRTDRAGGRARIPRINVEDFSLQGWIDRTCYEVRTEPAIYAALGKKGAKA